MIILYNKLRAVFLRVFLCSIFILLLCILYNYSFVQRAVGSELVDRIVAVVGDDIITLVEINSSYTPYVEKVKSLGYPEDKEREMLFKVWEDMLNQLVDKKLTDMEIKKYNIEVSDEEIQKTVERIKEANFFTDEDFRKELAKDGLTFEGYEKSLKDQMLRTRLVNQEIKSKIVITNDDIRAYYDSHPEEYGGKVKYHLRNIILKTPPMPDEMLMHTAAKIMNEVLIDLNKGEPFEEVGKKYKEELSIIDGGDVGAFELDELSPEIGEAVKGLKAGEFTSVIKTDMGYQIFFIKDLENIHGTSLEDASDEIERKIYNKTIEKRFQLWIEELREKTNIKILK